VALEIGQVLYPDPLSLLTLSAGSDVELERTYAGV
jgi:hypothetical protein